MSIESIIREFGVSLHIWRPTIGRATDGEITRTYAVASSATGFIQPSSQGQDVFEGRANSRTAGTIYFAGVVDVRIDDEIRDQSRSLSGSTICMIALGAALMLITMAGPDGPIWRPAAMGGLLAALALLIVVSIRDWKYYDEMLLQLSRDAGNIAFSGVVSVTLIWGSASWLGLVTAPTPLALGALTSGGFLIAIFVTSARKGLLRPR